MCGTGKRSGEVGGEMGEDVKKLLLFKVTLERRNRVLIMVRRIGEGRRTRGRVPVGRDEAGGLHVYINAGGSGAINPNPPKPEEREE